MRPKGETDGSWWKETHHNIFGRDVEADEAGEDFDDGEDDVGDVDDVDDELEVEEEE